MRVKCIAQEHNTMTRPGLEPGPLDSESSALTTRPVSPLCYVGFFIKVINFFKFIFCSQEVFYMARACNICWYPSVHLDGERHCATETPDEHVTQYSPTLAGIWTS